MLPNKLHTTEKGNKLRCSREASEKLYAIIKKSYIKLQKKKKEPRGYIRPTIKTNNHVFGSHQS